MTVFTWFDNLPDPLSCKDFTIIREKIQSAVVPFFSLSKTTSRNLNHQNNGFYILRTGFTMGYKMSQFFFFPGGVGTAQCENGICMELTRNFQICEKEKLRKTHAKKK